MFAYRRVLLLAPSDKLKGVHVLELGKLCSVLENAVQNSFGRFVKEFEVLTSVVESELTSHRYVCESLLKGENVSAHSLYTALVYLADVLC